MGGTVYHKSW